MDLQRPIVAKMQNQFHGLDILTESWGTLPNVSMDGKLSINKIDWLHIIPSGSCGSTLQTFEIKQRF